MIPHVNAHSLNMDIFALLKVKQSDNDGTKIMISSIGYDALKVII